MTKMTKKTPSKREGQYDNWQRQDTYSSIEFKSLSSPNIFLCRNSSTWMQLFELIFNVSMVDSKSPILSLKLCILPCVSIICLNWAKCFISLLRKVGGFCISNQPLISSSLSWRFVGSVIASNYMDRGYTWEEEDGVCVCGGKKERGVIYLYVYMYF